jgi:hypothetical protein
MAWTVTESYREWNNGNKMVTLSMASDANASSYDVDTYLSKIKGMFLHSVKFTPGTGDDQPSGTYNCDFEDTDATHILDTDANSATVPGYVDGSATLNFSPMIMDTLKVVCGTLGAANTTTIRMLFTNTPVHIAT